MTARLVLGCCPVCASRVRLLDGRIPAHPWVEPVATFSLFAQSTVLEFRGWCPGEGLRP